MAKAKKKFSRKAKQIMLLSTAIPAPPPFNLIIAAVIRKHPEAARKLPRGIRKHIKAVKRIHHKVFRRPRPKVVIIKRAPPFFPTPPKPVPTSMEFDDKIGVSQRRLTGNYNPVQLRGFSDLRPEILCLTDFQPAYKRSAYTKQKKNDRSILPVGEKIKVMLALNRLRNFNVRQLLDTLREDEDAAKVIDEIEREYDVKISEAIEQIRALTALLINLEKTKDGLNIRKSQRKIMAKISQRTADGSEPIGYQEILEDMGFSRKNIPQFSNTKILMQIMHDLNIILANYSPDLLGITNIWRKYDDDPFDIIENFFDPKREPTVLDDLRSQSGAGENYFDIASAFFQNMSSEHVFRSSGNRIKFILNFLSKEFVISAGLGSRVHQKGLISFGIGKAEGNVFDNILGVAGDTVITPPSGGSRALITSLNLTAADGTLVLPFESPLTPDDEKSFVTGAEFFVDAMVQGQTLMDPTPLIRFVKKFEGDTNMAQFLIERRLLALRGNSRSARISPPDLFDKVMESFKEFLASSIKSNTRSRVLTPIETQIAILELASRDLPLKLLVYQYILLIGLHLDTHSSTTRRTYKLYNQIMAANVPYIQDLPALRKKFRGRGWTPLNEFDTKNGIPTGAISEIIKQICTRILHIVAPSGNPSNQPRRNKNETFLPEIMIVGALHKIGDPTMPFQKINILLNDMVNSAYRGFSSAPRNNYFVIDKTWRTRFNGVPPAVLVAMMFEVFSSVAVGAGISFDSVVSRNRVFVVKVDNTEIMAIQNALAQTQDGGGDEPAVTAFPIALGRERKSLMRLTNRKIGFLRRMRSDLEEEDKRIASILNFLFVYFEHVWQQSKGLVTLTKQVKNKKSGKSLSTIDRIRNVQNRVDSQDIFGALNPAQVALSIRQTIEIKRSMRYSVNRNVSAFSDPTFLDKSAEMMLFALLREPMFKEGAAANMKIVTVGLPSGLKSSLKSAELQDEVVPGPEREVDVVSINVFRRDVEFDDIVFKPMSFTFELSRFTQIPPRIKVRSGRRMLGTSNSYLSRGRVKTFNIQVDEDFKWTTRGTHGGLSRKSDTILKVATGPSYIGMSTREKQVMFQNHVISYFLNIYLRLLTDIDFRESSFLMNDAVAQRKADQADRDRFLKLMLKRVKQVAGQQITLDQLRKSNQQMDILLDKLDNKDASEGVTDIVETSFKELSESANLEIAENVVNFIKSFSPDSLLTGADVTSTRLVSPKLFERIFHLPVDLDRFIVDVEATMATESGKIMFESAQFQSILIKNGAGDFTVKSRSPAAGYHILSELFVNLESKFAESDESEIVGPDDPNMIDAPEGDSGT